MGSYKRLLRFAAPYKWRFAAAMACLVVSGFLNLQSMVQIGPLVDKIFTEHDKSALVFYPILIVVIMLFKGVFSYLGDLLNNGSTNHMVADIRLALFDKIQSLPLAFHHRQRGGELMSRFTNDVNLMPGGISEVLGRGFGVGINVAFLVGGLFYINWKLTLIVMVVFPLAIGPLYVFGRRLRKHSTQGQEKMADMTSTLHEALAGIRVIMAFGMEQAEREKFRHSVQEYYRAIMRQIRVSALSGPVMELIGVIALALLFYLTGRLVMEGTMTAGKFMAYIGLIASLYPQLKSASGVNQSLQNSLTGCDRVFQILDETVSLVDPVNGRKMAPISRELVFDRVSFHYAPGTPVLKDITLAVPRGTMLAIVGPSGAGKTTLVDLVPRFHDTTRGKVLVDGLDVREASLASLRGQIGIVTQETFLFNDSIGANIAYGKPGATNQEIEAAARAANAHEFILAQPHGYLTEIGDRGVMLSGGQRQRLAIARAILKNPPILILDEATSALDTESERAVQEAMDRLMKERTSLVIAHRLSTVQHADMIAVLDKGELAELGRHEDLLKKDGLYARLYNMQFDTSREDK